MGREYKEGRVQLESDKNQNKWRRALQIRRADKTSPVIQVMFDSAHFPVQPNLSFLVPDSGKFSKVAMKQSLITSLSLKTSKYYWFSIN